MKNLITEQNAKTTKGEQFGYLTGILYMAPHSIVKGININQNIFDAALMYV